MYADLLKKDSKDVIQSHFSELLVRVSARLSTMKINMEEFRQYIRNYFMTTELIKDTDTIKEIFTTITSNKLWNCFRATSIRLICDKFAKGDEELSRLLDDYDDKFTAYQTATTIIDYIKNCNEDDYGAKSDMDNWFNNVKYRKISFKLKWDIMEKTLECITEFWEIIAKKLFLPPLNVILDTMIREGCIELTWVVPQKVIDCILDSSVMDAVFSQVDSLMQVKVDDEIIFKAAMVSGYILIELF